MHSWRDALHELLTDNTSLLESLKKIEKGETASGKLPNTKSQLCKNLRYLGKLSSLGGDFNTAQLCYDLAGDDLSLLRLIATAGNDSTALLDQISKRSQNKL